MAISIVVRDNTRCIGKRHLDMWTQTRRESYLIYPSARIPISIDERVTPLANEHDSPEETVRVVAATEFAAPEAQGANPDASFSVWRNFANGHGTSSPTDIQWLPLGYDICDETFLSGLMNCAVDRAHLGKSASMMTLSVNQYHLFDRILDAERFRAFLCAAVPEHAPFFLVRLFAAS